MSKSASAPTTAQSLGSLLKSARDIMRKDKGLNGDLDRLPMLTWIMLLKFLDDLELQREGEAGLAGKKFKPAIEPPYRWRDRAAQSDGITGDELLSFINNEDATLPNGRKRLSCEYLFAFMQSFDLTELQAGTSVPAISQGKVEAMEIPVPPPPEQHRIVAELNTLQTEVDALKRLQAETAAELDALLSPLLHRAFKGEL